MPALVRKPREDAIAYAYATQLPSPRRKPTGPYDFGDDATIGLQLKRNSYVLGAVDDNGDDVFGVYLGAHPDGFVVFVWDMLYRPTGAEVFETLEDLKAEWRLD